MPFLNTVLSFAVDLTATIIMYTGSDPNITNNTPLLGYQTSYPSFFNAVMDQIGAFHVVLPPSGAVAGIYATVDRERGVWKAPANVSVTGIVGPTLNITTAQQEGLKR